MTQVKFNYKWTPRIIEACKRAVKAIRPLFGEEEGKKELQRGAGGDITAKIDQVAENTIINYLQSFSESIVIISEERGLIFWDSSTKQTHPWSNKDTDVSNENQYPFFIIDPVDGSTNATRGIPFACISIAMASEPAINSVKIGVVMDIITKDVYYAEKNYGAYKATSPIKCSSLERLSKAVVGADFNSSQNFAGDIARQQRFLTKVKNVRIMGSCALELCLVAAGALDFYIDFRGGLRIVDILAGILIVQEAGGMVVNQQAELFQFNDFSLNTGYSILAFPKSLKKVIEDRLNQ